MPEHTEDQNSSPPYGLLGFFVALLVPVMLVVAGQFEIVSSDISLSGAGVAVFGLVVGAGAVLSFQEHGRTRQVGAMGVVSLLFLTGGVAVGVGIAPVVIERLAALGVVLLGTVVLGGAVVFMLTSR